MAEPIFRHRGEGQQFPEELVIDQGNALLRITLRGHPVPDPDNEGQLLPGPVASLQVPNHLIVQLVHNLLQVPFIIQLVGKKPFVMYFDSQAEIDEFVATIRSVRPELFDVDLGPPRGRQDRWSKPRPR